MTDGAPQRVNRRHLQRRPHPMLPQGSAISAAGSIPGSSTKGRRDAALLLWTARYNAARPVGSSGIGPGRPHVTIDGDWGFRSDGGLAIQGPVGTAEVFSRTSVGTSD